MADATIPGRLRRVVTLLTDPRTPRLPRMAVALAALYLISPVDLIPDFLIPVVGYLDDLTVVWMALRWLLKSAPEEGAAGVETPRASLPPGPEH